MNKKLTISTKDENVPLPAAVRGSKTPVLKLSITELITINSLICNNINNSRNFDILFILLCCRHVGHAGLDPQDEVDVSNPRTKITLA